MNVASGTRQASTFALLDLAGYAALTEQHGDLHGADLAIAFTESTRRCLDEGDRLIKTVGDAVLLASRDPEAGIRLVERVLVAFGKLDSIPLIRAGMHHGEAVEHEGDVFGTAVNVAARASAQAKGGQVLATRSVVDAARTLGVTVEYQGSVTFKNLREPYDVYELELVPRRVGGSVDPVCRMWVAQSMSKASFSHEGSEYWFCSIQCLDRFRAAPGTYINREVEVD